MDDTNSRIYYEWNFEKLELSLYIYLCWSLLNTELASYPVWLIMSWYFMSARRLFPTILLCSVERWGLSLRNCFNVAWSFFVISRISWPSLLLSISEVKVPSLNISLFIVSVVYWNEYAFWYPRCKKELIR